MKYVIIFLSLLLTGCTIAIPKHDLVVLNNITESNAIKEISEYNDFVMQKTNIISSITFNFRGRGMSALGITQLDTKNKDFKVAALNPMGVTLLAIKMEKGDIVSSYVMPQFEKGGLEKAAEMIGKDIAHIYFNRKIDLHDKSLTLDKYRVSINPQIDKNNYKYVFSGKPLKLMKKTMYENNKKVWSVDYYDYKNINNKEIAFKIFLKNYRYGYTLEIKSKDIKNELIR
ncbi:MAG: DUF3261 domain-containing protein [Desulfobacteraceae bacterium]|nr:DUF3261 domain-containing protein [Desulfobacteraceae bacterium]